MHCRAAAVRTSKDSPLGTTANPTEITLVEVTTALTVMKIYDSKFKSVENRAAPPSQRIAVSPPVVKTITHCHTTKGIFFSALAAAVVAGAVNCKLLHPAYSLLYIYFVLHCVCNMKLSHKHLAEI